MTEQQRKVLEFAETSLGSIVGDGECWTLAERALEGAGAKTSNDLQNVSNTLNYIWGDEIPAASAQPGDIVQFRDGFTFQVKVTKEDGAWETLPSFIIRPNHTAIVKKVLDAGKSIQLIGQNLPVGASVDQQDFYFKNYSFTKGTDKIEITVRGVAKFYRPQAKTARRGR